MSNTLSQKASRQFSPLILYHKYNSLDRQSHKDKQQCQPHSISMETRICQHLAETNKMLERNAQLWASQQEDAAYATLSDMTALHKKGFVNVVLGNETTTDQNENDMNDITPSSSISSTLSNSSTDSSDSTITMTTPICPGKTIPMSTLLITPPPSSPATVPLEPKTTHLPPPPLYQQNIYSVPSFYQYQYDDQHYHHRNQPSRQEAKESSPPYVAMPVSPSQPSTATGFVASFTSLPHHTRSETRISMSDGAHGYYDDKKITRRAAESLPTSASSTQPLGKKGLEPGMKRMKKRRRQNLPRHVTELLKYWLYQHKEHPYPTERQKLELAQRTDLGVNQISNWFINARRRILHPMIETEQQQQHFLAQQHQYMYMNHPPFGHQHERSHYYPSSALAVSTRSVSTLLPNEQEGKIQHRVDIYASRGLDESPHDIQHWSAHRTKLPTIEIPGSDQHLFAAVS